MAKIRTKKDAENLVLEMLENPDMEIVLWDEVDSNRIMSLTKDEEFIFLCNIHYFDTVNGKNFTERRYISEAREAIWENRKNVNKLNNF